MLTATVVSPAVAKPGGADRITICHVTNSANHPYLEITVDPSAFDGMGHNDHSYHVNKHGLVDKLAHPEHGCDDGDAGSVPATTTTTSSTTTSSTTTSLPAG